MTLHRWRTTLAVAACTSTMTITGALASVAYLPPAAQLSLIAAAGLAAGGAVGLAPSGPPALPVGDGDNQLKKNHCGRTQLVHP